MPLATGPNRIDPCWLEHMSMFVFYSDINKICILGASLDVFLTFLSEKEKQNGSWSGARSLSLPHLVRDFSESSW